MPALQKTVAHTVRRYMAGGSPAKQMEVTMNETQARVIAMIEEQKAKLPEWHPARMVGEHLKQIARDDPDDAALLAEDLRVKGKGIEDAEKKIKARADELEKVRRKEKGGNGGVAVMPWEAEDILRKFYGLRERSWEPGGERTATGDESTDCHGSRGGQGSGRPTPRNDSGKGKLVNLADFL